MPWQRAKFKGKDVWAEVDARGALVRSGGRVPIRYSAGAGAKVYRAGASGVELGDAPAEALPDGVSADAAKKPSRWGSGFGKAGTRTKAQAALAADAARALIDGLAEGTTLAFSDGACRGNPGPAGAGAWVRLADGRTAEVSRALGTATNNVGELTAVGLVLDVCDDADLPPDAPVALLTDSQYAHGLLAEGWKAKANAELVADLRARLAARPGVTLHWIAGHVGIAGNERADALANEGVGGRSGLRWL